MKICSWNLNSIKNKLPELQTIVAQEPIEVLLLQETRLKPNENHFLENFTLHRKDVDDYHTAGGRVLVAVKTSMYSEPMNLQTELQAVAVTILSPIKNGSLFDILSERHNFRTRSYNFNQTTSLTIYIER